MSHICCSKKKVLELLTGSNYADQIFVYLLGWFLCFCWCEWILNSDSDDAEDMWRILTKMDQVKQSQVLDEFCLQFTLTSDTQIGLSLIETTWVNRCSTLYCSVLSVFTVVDIFTAVLLDCSVNCEMMHLFSEARKT